MARKVVFYQTGSANVLKIEEVPTPEPGAGEVRIRVRAIGINRSEVNVRAGTYAQPASFPAQLGAEASGEIDAIGPDVCGFCIGDAVSVLPNFNPAQYGMYGDLVLAPASSVVKHPATLSSVEAAATWMQFTTAWAGLVDLANIGNGDVVLITAASNSVGLAAIQVARWACATPVALTRHSDKAAALKEAGAEHVIATEEQDIVEEVMRLTDGKGARVVLDSVGGPGFAKLISATSMDGLALVYGVLSKENNTFPAIQLLRRRITIRGFGATGALSDATKTASMERYVVKGLATGALRPKVSKTFPFEQIADAHRYLEASEHMGKVVVTV